MKKMLAATAILASITALSGCSAHNPFIVTDTTQSTPLTQNRYPAYQGRVFITEDDLPANIDFEPISTIDVGKIWYGSSQDVYVSMATRARELGANVVIKAKRWRQPSGFSWAAPHGSGQAGRVKDIKAFEALGVKGGWY